MTPFQAEGVMIHRASLLATRAADHLTMGAGPLSSADEWQIIRALQSVADIARRYHLAADARDALTHPDREETH